MPRGLIGTLIFIAGLLSGLVLPQLNIWPYSACHGLGGFIEIAQYSGGGDHVSRCVIPWGGPGRQP